MSFSDFILAILIIIAAACVVWILDLNPYSKQLQVYSQTCDYMILENTYCKGNWQDNPVQIFTLDKSSNQITSTLENQTNSNIYQDCAIQDHKNWVCIDPKTQEKIIAKDGILIESEASDVRQITRLQSLQNKILEIIT